MTAANQETTTNPKILAPHLLAAAAYSLLWPGLGGAYLGKNAGFGEKLSSWREKSAFLPIALLQLLICVAIYTFDLTILLVCAGIWLLMALQSITREWLWALRNTSLVRIPDDKKRDDPIFSLFMSGWIILVVLFQGMPSIELFDSPNDTPLIRAGETLYGIPFQEGSIRLSRGQLVLVQAGDGLALRRIVAGPGDIFAAGPKVLFINGYRLRLASSYYESPAATQRGLEELVAAINQPSDDQKLAKIEGRTLVFDAAQPMIVGHGEYVLANDADLFTPGEAVVPTEMITQSNVIAIPRGLLWSWRDHPGTSSKIAQPAYAWTR